MEDLKQANEKLNNENRSLKSSLSKAQNQIKRTGKIGDRMLFLVSQIRNVKARIATNMGDIELKFHPEKAPVHCLAFITRAESGFYDNTKFHRVIKNFMIQGGDPNSKDDDPSDDGMGGPLVHIPHEFNDTNHVPGILSMARVSDVSAGAG
ncbi:MAG: peptidylprolyl isomerase, partial [Gemmatimonadota bacterium]|nr:peptidylprolyl isomerase [Gemmatimonadota bacterium]